VCVLCVSVCVDGCICLLASILIHVHICLNNCSYIHIIVYVCLYALDSHFMRLCVHTRLKGRVGVEDSRGKWGKWTGREQVEGRTGERRRGIREAEPRGLSTGARSRVAEMMPAQPDHVSCQLKCARALGVCVCLCVCVLSASESDSAGFGHGLGLNELATRLNCQ
jgi:hypothetical protein